MENPKPNFFPLTLFFYRINLRFTTSLLSSLPLRISSLRSLTLTKIHNAPGRRKSRRNPHFPPLVIASFWVTVLAESTPLITCSSRTRPVPPNMCKKQAASSSPPPSSSPTTPSKSSSFPSGDETLPENAWLQKYDHRAFRDDVTQLGVMLEKQQGEADVRHLDKVRRRDGAAAGRRAVDRGGVLPPFPPSQRRDRTFLSMSDYEGPASSVSSPLSTARFPAPGGDYAVLPPFSLERPFSPLPLALSLSPFLLLLLLLSLLF